MLLLARPLCLLAASRAARLALGLLAAASIAMLLASPPAGAFISGEFGLQGRRAPTTSEGPLQYHGGPVLHSSHSYAIYWDPAEKYRFDWKRLIDNYFYDIAASSGSLADVLALDEQYTDATGRAANQSTFAGAYTDSDPYPTSENCSEGSPCLTDAQIRTELEHVVSSGALPGATGPGVYYVLTPPGVTVCTETGGSGTCSNSTAVGKEAPNGMCSYHSVIDAGGPGQIIYAVAPWVAGDAGLVENESPITTAGPSNEVLACQDDRVLEEPNQLGGRDAFEQFEEGLPDVIINGLSIEQRDIAIDPLLNGWYQTSTKAEESDFCKWNLGPLPESAPTPNKNTQAASESDQTLYGANYYVQWAFDSSDETNGTKRLCWGGVTLEPFFTAPTPVNAGDVVGLDATESDITFDANTTGLPGDEPYAAPTYKWEFGDGTSAAGANAADEFHSYQYGGTYRVTLTVVDGGGNSASTVREITVEGPPNPASAGSGSGSGAGTGSGVTPSASAPATTSTATGASTTTPGPKPAPRPVATAAVLSRTLRAVARKGLIVRYSVSERATGHFEVLLATSVAKRIGLHGPAATGLAAGTAPQTVIGKALLVTTKGGRNTIKIQLGKKTAAALEKLRKASLMVRLIVRSGSTGTTTVLSAFTLGS